MQLFDFIFSLDKVILQLFVVRVGIVKHFLQFLRTVMLFVLFSSFGLAAQVACQLNLNAVTEPVFSQERFIAFHAAQWALELDAFFHMLKVF